MRAWALCLAMACSSIASWAGDIVYGGVSYEMTDGSTDSKGRLKVKVLSGQNLSGDINIPATFSDEYYTYIVTGMDCNALFFDNATSLTVDNSSYTVTLPQSFCGYCTDLKSVSFSGAVSKIGSYAFKGCTELTSVSFGDVGDLGECVFRTCEKLETVTFGAGSTFTTMDEAFTGCLKLGTITIPASVTKISNSFFACTNINTVTCMATTPPVCSSSFTAAMLDMATLIVPEGSESSYKTADTWRDFGTVKTTTGIANVTAADKATETARFDINGARLSSPKAGINIVKMSDGTVKKICVAK